MQNLIPIGRDGSKAFQLDWVGITKFDNRAYFSNWAEALKNDEAWEQGDSNSLWEEELKRKGKQGKLYGVDTQGVQNSIES